MLVAHAACKQKSCAAAKVEQKSTVNAIKVKGQFSTVHAIDHEDRDCFVIFSYKAKLDFWMLDKQVVDWTHGRVWIV